MKSRPFRWSSTPVTHSKKILKTNQSLATKSLGIVYKHFLVPMSRLELSAWKSNDHFMHRLAELEDVDHEVWIRPWLVGGWLNDKETLFEFEPTEYNEETFGPSVWSELVHWREHHKRGVLFGLFFTVTNRKDHWKAVFAFTLDERPQAKKIKDLLIKETMCLSLDGEAIEVEAWLDWAYSEGNVA